MTACLINVSGVIFFPSRATEAKKKKCRLISGYVLPNPDRYIYIYLSGFDKRYLQKFLATVSFEACSVLDHSFFCFNDLFSTKIPVKATVDQKTCV